MNIKKTFRDFSAYSQGPIFGPIPNEKIMYFFSISVKNSQSHKWSPHFLACSVINIM